MPKLHICIVTGTRAEFGIWRPVLAAMGVSKRLDLRLIVTGMHLLPKFGRTVKDIEKSGVQIAARVPMYRGNEPPAASLARGTAGLAAAYRKLGADIVMVLGDRLEMLAAASAALAERIPIAHVHGGETAPGVWDEQIRHAITKMAHLHFCATPAAVARIRRAGESPGAIHRVGAPALDSVIASLRTTRKVLDQIRIVAGTSPLLLLHPSSADDALEYRRTLMLVDLLQAHFDAPGNFKAIGPNNDPGHRGILRALHERSDAVQLDMSLTQGQFWLKLVSSGLLIGNSSAGIIEAATLGVAVINIGDRQAGRERNANVIDVPWQAAAIKHALDRAISDRAYLKQVARRKNIYGDGYAAARILRVLESVAENGISLEKRFVD